MYVVAVIFEIHPGHMDDFLPLMRQQAQNSLTLEADCHQFDVSISDDRVLMGDVAPYGSVVRGHAFAYHLDSGELRHTFPGEDPYNAPSAASATAIPGSCGARVVTGSSSARPPGRTRTTRLSRTSSRSSPWTAIWRGALPRAPGTSVHCSPS